MKMLHDFFYSQFDIDIGNYTLAGVLAMLNLATLFSFITGALAAISTVVSILIAVKTYQNTKVRLEISKIELKKLSDDEELE